MDNALVACRAVHFVSAMLVFGASAFRFYALGGADPTAAAAFDVRLRHPLLVSAILAALSGLAMVPLTGSMMAGSAAAAFDWHTISTVLWQTGFGRVWRCRLLFAALLVATCAIRRPPAGYGVALAALLLASLGWVGHATIGRGPVSLAHELNQSVHLLAAGVWIGGLLPLAMLVVRARRSGGAAPFALMRQALPQFSHMGYAAVVLVALTGIVNTAILAGSVDGLTGTPYGRLLLAKIALFLLLVGAAGINRLVLVPRIERDGLPLAGTAALVWMIGIEQALAVAILVVASLLGTWPPPLHGSG